MLNEHNKPRPPYYYLTYLWCIGVDLFFWFWIGIVLHALWGTKRHWVAGCLCLEFKPNSWPTRTWYRTWLGTTFGHTIIYAPEKSGVPGIVDTYSEQHEHIHVHQYEVLQLLSAILTATVLSTGFEWTKLLILFLGSGFGYLAGMVQALIRGESPYWDNIFEEAAYGIVKK